MAAGPLNLLRLPHDDSTWVIVGGAKEQYRNYTFHAKIEYWVHGLFIVCMGTSPSLFSVAKGL